jgi:hypothetical protein
MQAITDTSMVPPGGWIYLDEDGNKFRGTTLEHAVVVVREAYFASKKTPPKNLEYAIMDQICKRLESDPHSDRCFDFTPPTKTELLTRAGNAIKNFVNNGFKMVTAEQLLDRRAVCEECSLWNGEGSFGMGRCGSCGCSGLKLHVAGEKCPLNKWEEI